jgi:hypothetical protein
VSQFQVAADRIEISKLDMWPSGHIEAVPLKFSVLWRIESPQSDGGVFETRQDDLTPLFTAKAAWDILRHSVLNLAEDPIIQFELFSKRKGSGHQRIRMAHHR